VATRPGTAPEPIIASVVAAACETVPKLLVRARSNRGTASTARAPVGQSVDARAPRRRRAHSHRRGQADDQIGHDVCGFGTEFRERLGSEPPPHCFAVRRRGPDEPRRGRSLRTDVRARKFVRAISAALTSQLQNRTRASSRCTGCGLGKRTDVRIMVAAAAGTLNPSVGNSLHLAVESGYTRFTLSPHGRAPARRHRCSRIRTSVNPVPCPHCGWVQPVG
jgi:predicted RNA-binding Zn-ribbon protein involved in translation (DUF1610 family)